MSIILLKEHWNNLQIFQLKQKKAKTRFLLVTVDVQTGDAVTFDSYTKEAKYHDDKNIIFIMKV